MSHIINMLKTSVLTEREKNLFSEAMKWALPVLKSGTL